MQDDPITRALREAQMHAVGRDGEDIPAAPIIAAFLRALHDTADGAHLSFRADLSQHDHDIWTGEMLTLAEAVEAVDQAQGGGDG